MPTEKNTTARIFNVLDDFRERIARVEAYEETEKEEISSMREDMKRLQAAVNQIIGKNTMLAGIYGVVGAIVSGIVVWLVSMFGGK